MDNSRKTVNYYLYNSLRTNYLLIVSIWARGGDGGTGGDAGEERNQVRRD